MKPPRIVVRYFNEGSKDVWTRLVRVLEHSARQHCPDWTFDVQEIPASTVYSPLGRQGDVANTRKLDAWADAVVAAADGDRILLLDADTLIRRPLDEVWAPPFDLAYTVKGEEARYPFNGGVVFLRVSPKTRAFVLKWRDVTRWFLGNAQDHQVWLPPFGGINQSALGMLFTPSDVAWPQPFKGYRPGLSTRRLPCLEWNCEDEHWEQFDPDVTRITHYKSQLQRSTLNREDVSEEFSTLVSEWREAESAMKRQGARMIPKADRNTQITSDELSNPEQAIDVSITEQPAQRVEDIIVPQEPLQKPLTQKQRRRQKIKGAV